MLLDIINYILIKEGYQCERFTKKRSELNQNLQVINKFENFSDYENVNKVLFGNQLGKIFKIIALQDGDLKSGTQKQVHLSMIRIYLASFSKKRQNFQMRKYLNTIKMSGRSMLHYIFKQYMQNNPSRKFIQLFKKTELENPNYLFILNYMQTLFLPIFQRF